MTTKTVKSKIVYPHLNIIDEIEEEILVEGGIGMTLIIIGDVLYIREICADEASEDVLVSLPGAADGTEIAVHRTSDNKYCLAKFKNGEAKLARSFFFDGHYRIQIKLPGGATVSCELGCDGERLHRLWRGGEAEIAALWRALITFVESRKEKDDEVDRLVIGYTSE